MLLLLPNPDKAGSEHVHCPDDKLAANCGAALLLLLALTIVPGCTTVDAESIPEIVSLAAPGESCFDSDTEILKVMTLNLGHGKGRGIIQELVSNNRTRKNLDEIAGVLARERPHVAAFQEADIKARRSGGFNHIHYIAERAGYREAVHGEHIKNLGLYHGTALISMLKIRDPLSVTFNPAKSSSDKGFTVCTIEFGAGGTKLDVVSVHLDIASNSARQKQVRRMVGLLSKRGNPLVVMGDFNCQLQDSKKVLDILKDGLSLSAYELYSEELRTFPLLNRRLDWILISPELEFHNYAVLDDHVSDHSAVVAELMLAGKKQ
ncbi:MAG: endonuclease/exonuclease/phosphatase family protein [Planctomycetota bacterium]